MAKVVISDASCFILLQKIDALDILPKTFEQILTTPTVVAEFRFDVPPWLEIRTPSTVEVVEELKTKIDPGEATAIALALEVPGSVIILDDLKARIIAKNLGLHINGTVGVILKAKRDGNINLVKPYIDKIQLTNFRLSQSIVDEVLHLAGESETE